MKVYLLFVLVFCVHSNYAQFNRQQQGQTQSLSYAESDFNPLPPVAKTTTTTPEPDTTTKKKGFFSGFTGLFKSKDKETTTTTTEQPTTKKSLATTPTAKPASLATTSTIKSAPAQIPTSTPKLPPRADSPVSTPKVPPRSDSPTPPTPPPRPTSQQQQTSTASPKKTTKDDFPPLPTQPTARPAQQPATVPSAWGKPPSGPPPAVPNAWGTAPTGPTPKPQSFFPQTPTSPTRKPAQSPVADGPVTDAELLTLSDALFSKDINNPFKYVTVNYQGKLNYQSTAQTDEAPQPLLKIDEKLFTVSTVEKMKPLYNNYEQDTAINEYVSPNERKEEDEFLDAVLATAVMRHAMTFLTQKGVVTPDPQTHRELLKTIWFNLYSRGQGKIGSSGFEHVFLSEVKNGTVMGLHNWIYMSEAEKSGDLDYKGWTKKIDLGNKGQIAKVRFALNSLDKPTNSLFIGTSPELEMALYTVCFELRADKDCRLAYGGKDFNIVTHSYRYRGKNLIGSAYPEI